MAVTARTFHDFIDGEAPSEGVWDQLNKSWGVIVSADSDLGGIAGTMTTLTGCSCDATQFVALANRRYRISFSADVLGTVAGDLCQVRMLWDGANTLADLKAYGTVRTDDPVTIGRSWIINLSTGGHSFALQIARQDGSGTLTGKASSHFTIEDAGPF